MIFLRIHMATLLCLASSLPAPLSCYFSSWIYGDFSLLIIVRSNLFLSSNANHPIGLPHTPLLLHARLALCNCCLCSFFVSIFCVFFLLFHAVHGPSFHAICINSTSPCRVDQSASSQQVFLSTQRITHTLKFPLPYCITNFTSRSAFTTPKPMLFRIPMYYAMLA